MKRILLTALLAFLALSCKAPRLYDWEAGREGAPRFADITLVGAFHREPYDWTAERFAPHVSYVDTAGTEHWLFEGFLFLESHDIFKGRNFAVEPRGLSADRSSWEDLLERWVGPDGYVKALDDAAAAVAERIGAPARKRGVILMMPDPVRFAEFADKESATDYWGEVDGRRLDFAATADQLAAWRWFIDTARERMAALKLRYTELSGFYILSESLHLPDGETDFDRINWQHKNWEILIPAIAEYLHGMHEGLYWIPYFLAPGHKVWKELGFDQAWIQPNWYWDLRAEGRHPFEKTVEAMRRYDLGMELEFEFSMVSDVMRVVGTGPDGSGNPAFTLEDVPALQDRFRNYMREFRENGFYGTAPIALYSGSDALHQLAASGDAADRAIYHELCQFILGNPLRKP